MKSVVFAGSGGQGILLAGTVLAHAAMLQGKSVTWFPSYGAEMRGGTANCTVVISEDFIGSPIVARPDCLVAMNTASLKVFAGRVIPGGLIVIDSESVKEESGRGDVRVLKVNSSELARLAGNPRAANIVLLGALVAGAGLVSSDLIKKTLTDMKIKNLEGNIAAFEKGVGILGT